MVVLIIGITAAIATPTLVRSMRETRSRDLAQRVAQVYGMARMRALRGSSVLVRYNKATGIRVLESIEGKNEAERRVGTTYGASCAARPGLGCISNAAGWSQPDTETATARTVQTLTWPSDFSVTTATDTLDVCFSPSGRSFFSTDGQPPTQPMVGVRLLSVKRGDGLSRTIALLPNGIARLAL